MTTKEVALPGPLNLEKEMGKQFPFKALAGMLAVGRQCTMTIIIWTIKSSSKKNVANVKKKNRQLARTIKKITYPHIKSCTKFNFTLNFFYKV